MAQARPGYTLVELIVIILLIAVGTTLVLSIHTKMQRDSLDVEDEKRVRQFQQELSMYAMKSGGNYPCVESYVSEPDRMTRFSDYRLRSAKALRLLFRGNNLDEYSMLQILYSPLDGSMPDYVRDSMIKNSALTDKDTMCFSSYAYDPGHRRPDTNRNDPGDGSTVIFGHSPSFLLRQGRNSTRVVTANGQVLTMYLKSEHKAYEIDVHVGGKKPSVVQDDIYADQADTLFNRDSYLSDAIPFLP